MGNMRHSEVLFATAREWLHGRGNRKMTRMFRVIQIQTIDLCNRRCDFCPNSLDIRKTGSLITEDTFGLILDQLKEIGYNGRISPYLMNEPLLDPRLPKLIQRIREMFSDNIIFINTNGDLLDRKDIRSALANSGLDGIQVNCYGDEKLYLERRQLVEQWAIENNRILLHDSGSTRRMKKRNGKVNLNVQWVSNTLPSFFNRGGHVPHVAPSGKYSTGAHCGRPFKQMYINYLGQAVLCCCDYRFEVVLGDIHKASLRQIWFGEDYQKYRKLHEIGRTDLLKLCRTCNLLH